MSRLVLLLAALIAAGAAACERYDPTPIATACGDHETFGEVAGTLQVRCGSLDCHGRIERPLRIFGQLGARLPIAPEYLAAHPDIDPAQYFPGGQEPTTADELLETFRSVCGLEPEVTTRVVRREVGAGELTLVRKPRLAEEHAGGRIWAAGSAGDRCLTSWLDPLSSDTGAFAAAACVEELGSE